METGLAGIGRTPQACNSWYAPILLLVIQACANLVTAGEEKRSAME